MVPDQLQKIADYDGVMINFGLIIMRKLTAFGGISDLEFEFPSLHS